MKTMPIDDLISLLDKLKQEGREHISVLDSSDKPYGLDPVRIIDGAFVLELSQAKKKGLLGSEVSADKVAVVDLLNIIQDAKSNNAKYISVLDHRGDTNALKIVRSIDKNVFFEFEKEQRKLIKTGKERSTSKHPKYFEFRAFLESIQLNPYSYSSAINTATYMLTQNAQDFEGMNINLWEIEEPKELEKLINILFADKFRNYAGYKNFIEQDEKSNKTHSNALKKYREFLRSRKL